MSGTVTVFVRTYPGIYPNLAHGDIRVYAGSVPPDAEISARARGWIRFNDIPIQQWPIEEDHND